MNTVIHAEDILNIMHRYIAIEFQLCILQLRYALFMQYSSDR